jgi:hypothetical protein
MSKNQIKEIIMKKNLKIIALAIGIMAVGMTGCKKEAMEMATSGTDVSNSEIQALVVQTENENSNQEITFDEVTSSMAAVNEGVAPDYLVSSEDLDADETSSNPNVRGRSQIRNNSFIRCIRGVKPDSAQARQIKAALNDYNDCKSSAIKRAGVIHRQLQAKYKGLVEDQRELLRDSTITKQQYKERITRLRFAFQKELKELHLKEKLGDALKACHEKFLRKLHGILSERQWKAFIACAKK